MATQAQKAVTVDLAIASRQLRQLLVDQAELMHAARSDKLAERMSGCPGEVDEEVAFGAVCHVLFSRRTLMIDAAAQAHVPLPNKGTAHPGSRRILRRLGVTQWTHVPTARIERRARDFGRVDVHALSVLRPG